MQRRPTATSAAFAGGWSALRRESRADTSTTTPDATTSYRVRLSGCPMCLRAETGSAALDGRLNRSWPSWAEQRFG